MSFAAEGSAIRSRVEALWADTAIARPNVEFDPSPGVSFLRLTIRNGESSQPWIGPNSKRRSVGVVFGEIFTPSNSGDGAARTLADTFAGIFRNVQVSGITFDEPSAREAPSQEEPWYRWLVEVPYYRDWSPSGVDEVASYNSLKVTQVAHGFELGDWLTAASGVWAKALANSASTLSYPGVVTRVDSADTFRVTLPGGKANLPAHGFGAAGAKLWLSQGTSGAATTAEPDTGFVQQVATVWDADHLIVNDYPAINKG